MNKGGWQLNLNKIFKEFIKDKCRMDRYEVVAVEKKGHKRVINRYPSRRPLFY